MPDYTVIVQQYLKANQSLDRVHTFQYKDKWFIGMNTVFSPFLFEDTYFFEQHLPSQINADFLEIGCGTGLISIFKALDGLNVVATDINTDAIVNTKINALLHSVESRVNVLNSDLFKELNELQKFDIIFWNPPFIFADFNPETILQKSVFDFGYANIKKFIDSCSNYLKPDGRAFLGFSSTSGDFNRLCEIANQNKVSLYLISQMFLDGNPGEDPFSLELYELC